MSTAVEARLAGGAVAEHAAAAVRSQASPRLAFMDNIRIALTSLVIVVHLAIAYGAPVGDWYYVEDGDVGLAVAVVMVMVIAVAQAFFMGTFFLFSAYLTPGSLERKGTWSFAVDRVKRLGIPLLVFTFVLQQLTDYLSAYPEGWFHGTLLDYIRGGYSEGPSVGPMWYVEALLLFTAAYLLWSLATRALGLRATVRAGVPTNRVIAAFAVALALASYAVRLWWAVGRWFEPMHLQLGHFAQYVALFVVGFIAYRSDWLTKLTVAQARPWRWVIAGLLPVFPMLVLYTFATTGGIDAFLGGPTWHALVMALWEQVLGIAVIVTLIPWFRERFGRQGRLARAMSGATYATYVTHPLTLVLLGWTLKGVALPLGLKFVLVIPLGIAACFLVGHLVRRLPLVREVL